MVKWSTVPPWRTEWAEEPPWNLERKLRRREKLGTPVRPILGNKQDLRQSWRRSADNLYRQQYPQYQTPQHPRRQPPTPQPRHLLQTPQPRPASTPQQFQPSSIPIPVVQQQQQQIPAPLQPQQSQLQLQQPSQPPSYQTRSISSPIVPEKASIRNYEEQCRERRQSKRRSKSRNKEAKEAKEIREVEEFLRRKSPQRVSFTRRAPKVYQRTPESSISGGPKEKHTVV
uniref:Uncharacterized protein n=1 Tax=Panagrolaimus superbus TaxID=310955 RepID=A0A914Y002_9BILA